MRNIIKAIDFVLWALIGLYAGACVYQLIDYLCYPAKYEIMSAPWYTILIVYTVIAAGLALILLLVRLILRRILNRKLRAEEDQTSE